MGPAALGTSVTIPRAARRAARRARRTGLTWTADGDGTVVEQRLYQLIRQHGPVTERTFEITFLDPGVEAYAFTFG